MYNVSVHQKRYSFNIQVRFLSVSKPSSSVLFSLFFHLLVAQRIILHSHFHCSLGFHPSHLQFCFPFSSTCSACIYVLLSFHCFPLFPLSSGPSFVYPALSPSPSICMCFYVCVAAGCLWLFFRQRPRRLDCHNVWS